jgi:hypothetical protein
MGKTLHTPASLLFASALAMTALPSLAADPTIAECLGASERALSLRSSHKLRDARAQFVICAAATCPADVRSECQRRVTEVNAAIPTVVFEAKDADGNDLTAVKVSMDGQPLADKLEGLAISIDPGAHQFLFEAEGRTPIQKTIVINESEVGRHEQITFGKPPEPPPAAPAPVTPTPAPTAAVPPPPAPPPETAIRSSPPPAPQTPQASEAPSYWTGQRTLGAILTGVGLVGVGVSGVLGLMAKSQFTTAEGETGSQRYNDSGSAVGTGNVATAIVVTGSVLTAAGLIVWLTGPSAKAAVGVNGTGLVIRGRF